MTASVISSARDRRDPRHRLGVVRARAVCARLEALRLRLHGEDPERGDASRRSSGRATGSSPTATARSKRCGARASSGSSPTSSRARTSSTRAAACSQTSRGEMRGTYQMYRPDGSGLRRDDRAVRARAAVLAELRGRSVGPWTRARTSTSPTRPLRRIEEAFKDVDAETSRLRALRRRRDPHAQGGQEVRREHAAPHAPDLARRKRARLALRLERGTKRWLDDKGQTNADGSPIDLFGAATADRSRVERR